jgi:hypothetical protein
MRLESRRLGSDQSWEKEVLVKVEHHRSVTPFFSDSKEEKGITFTSRLDIDWTVDRINLVLA